MGTLTSEFLETWPLFIKIVAMLFVAIVALIVVWSAHDSKTYGQVRDACSFVGAVMFNALLTAILLCGLGVTLGLGYGIYENESQWPWWLQLACCSIAVPVAVCAIYAEIELAVSVIIVWLGIIAEVLGGIFNLFCDVLSAVFSRRWSTQLVK